MKRVFIIHGWDGYPEHSWYLWLKRQLEEKGFQAFVPAMPDTEAPKINEWVNKIKEIVGEADKETFFVGHSIGCQAILRYLETLFPEIKVGGAVFVAPWMELDEQTIKEEGEEIKEIAKPWMETPINWEKVKPHTGKFACILSDNDYYVPLSNKKIFEKNLGAKIIIDHNKGHFTEDDGIKELPIALEELLKL